MKPLSPRPQDVVVCRPSKPAAEGGEPAVPVEAGVVQWVTAVECPGRSLHSAEHATLNGQLLYEDLPQATSTTTSDDPKQPWRGAGRRLVVPMHHAAGVCLRGGTGASDIARLW